MLLLYSKDKEKYKYISFKRERKWLKIRSYRMVSFHVTCVTECCAKRSYLGKYGFEKLFQSLISFLLCEGVFHDILRPLFEHAALYLVRFKRLDDVVFKKLSTGTILKF